MTRVATLLCLLIAAGAAQAQEHTVTAADRSQLSVTIYNNGLAYVRDRRLTDLPAGPSALVFGDVGAALDPTSTVIDGDGLTVLEQSFQREVISQQTLLQRSIGKKVRVIRTHPTTGADIVEEATVLAVDGGLVLRIGDRIETGTPGRIVFDSVPRDLHSQPTLVVHIKPEKAGPTPITLSYLTGGLTWRADYAAFLDSATMRLDGRATLSNDSGTSFKNAELQLVAGDVRRVSSPQPSPMPKEARVMAMAGQGTDIVPENLGEQHLYTLPGRIDLADKENKQVGLLSVARAAITREYVSEGYVGPSPRHGPPAETHAAVRVSFRNSQADGLGMPMPGGVIRAYERDASGAPQFVGEDTINHTPVDGTVMMSLGRAFDVTVQRTQTDFHTQGKPAQSFDSAQRIEVRNARDEAVTVTVVDTIGGDWTVSEESMPHRTTSSGRAEWRVPVPAGGKSVLTYKVSVQLPR